MVNKFANYCLKNFDLKQKHYANEYYSMSVCLIDCIFSLRAKYFLVTVPVVDRYAKAYMNGDKYSSGDDLTELIKHIDEAGGAEIFAESILKNRQVLSGLRKSSVMYKLAKKLLSLGINTMNDFKNFKDQILLENTIKSVRGMGDAGTDYLFMLAGSDDRCKPDVHLHRCIVNAIGHDVTNNECQMLMREAVAILKEEFPDLTVKELDGLIWFKYQSMKIDKVKKITYNVKITVVKIVNHFDLIKEYENPIEHTCSLKVGDTFVSRNASIPLGFCGSAWESVGPFVKRLANGEENFYDGWMKNKKSAMISCNDGFRPVSFYLEVIED